MISEQLLSTGEVRATAGKIAMERSQGVRESVGERTGWRTVVLAGLATVHARLQTSSQTRSGALALAQRGGVAASVQPDLPSRRLLRQFNFELMRLQQATDRVDLVGAAVILSMASQAQTGQVHVASGAGAHNCEQRAPWERSMDGPARPRPDGLDA